MNENLRVNSSKAVQREKFEELMANAKEVSVLERETFSAEANEPTMMGDREFIVQIHDARPVEKQKSSPSFHTDFLLHNASVLQKNGEFLLARNIYSFVLKKDLKNRHALTGLGICLFELGEYEPAIKCLKAAEKIHPDVRAIAWMAIVESRAGNSKRALEFFSQIDCLDSLDSSEQFVAYKEWGNCLTRVQQFDLAERKYEKALALEVDSSTILINLGTLQLQKQNLDKARGYFDQVLDSDSSNVKALCGLGFVALEMEDNTRARLYFRQVARVDASNELATMQLLNLSEGKQDYVLDKEHMLQFVQTNSTNISLCSNVAKYFLAYEDWENCDQAVTAILKQDPENSIALQLRKSLVVHLKGRETEISCD